MLSVLCGQIAVDRLLPTPPRKQCQLPPLPMAIDVDKTDLAQPCQLGFHFEEFV